MEAESTVHAPGIETASVAASKPEAPKVNAPARKPEIVEPGIIEPAKPAPDPVSFDAPVIIEPAAKDEPINMDKPVDVYEPVIVIKPTLPEIPAYKAPEAERPVIAIEPPKVPVYEAPKTEYPVMAVEPKAPEVPLQTAKLPQVSIPPQIVSMATEPPPETVFLQVSGPPERLVKPAVPEYIMGEGLIPQKAMTAFLLGANPKADTEFVDNLMLIYMEEAAIEGVNHDTAFAQMCLETGYLRYGGLVTPDMNNFCGLGATGPSQTGLKFPDPRTGVRAHIQHLKAYATDAPLKQELVDPRYFYVRLGSSPAIKGLAGTWATDRLYADKIKNILERLYSFAYEGSSL